MTCPIRSRGKFGFMVAKKKKEKIKFFGQVGYWLVLLTLFLIAGLTAVSALNIPGNYKLLTIQSGSMEPAIKQGSIVIVKPAKEYQQGEMITFIDIDNPKYSLTHRIFEVRNDNGRITYVTKGDANETPDFGEVLPPQIFGKVFLTIPFVGYPISFAKTLPGLLILVIIPAAIIVYSELQNIRNEFKKIILKRKKEE